MIYVGDYDYSIDYKIVSRTRKDEEGNKVVDMYSDNIYTLDFETTSYYIKDNKAYTFKELNMTDKSKEERKETMDSVVKQSVVYIWQFGINDTVIYGRTLLELRDFIEKLDRQYTLNVEGERKVVKRICYIHNLSFDFQLLRNILEGDVEVFARKERKPIYAGNEGWQFRCSLFLTNKSLDKAIKDVKAPVKKMVGDLDYDKIRTPLTVLTSEELEYCKNDILGLYYVILEKKEIYGNTMSIPLTQTGQVRNEFKKRLWSDRKYTEQVALTWPNFKQFKQLSEIFYGGYTHANYKYANKTLRNVYSYDIVSSYPSVLATKKYPTKKFTKTYEKDLSFLDFENYAYILDITFYDLKPKINNTFLSYHKAQKKDYDDTDIVNEHIKIDNGRLREADKARYILTDCDINIVNSCYTFTYKINAIYTAAKDYLPHKIINYILELFNNKTKYKDVEGQESKYKEAKEYLNSVYGMFVTKILTDEITYDYKLTEKGHIWETEELTEEVANEKLLDMIGPKRKQFFQYSTGVWCAAYARKHLWDMILMMDKDVVYVDTDSIKFVNKENIKHFEEDNKRVKKDIFNVCLSVNEVDPASFECQAPDGHIERLGYFEADGVYSQFKTLGAKKYAFINEGETEVQITVAGANKKTGKKRFKDLTDFKPGTLLDYEYAGKNEISYVDNQRPFRFEDGFETGERYGVVLTPTTYFLNITSDYSNLISEEIQDNFNTSKGARILN